MIKNDKWIKEQAANGMITPFEFAMIRYVEPYRKVFSYGTGSYGYDIRLSSKEFKVFRHVPGSVVNPKDFNPKHLVDAELHSDDWGDYFIIPGHSYGLGVAVERLEVPENITVICMGKSSYARCALCANVTPAEAGWKGHLTLEFSNTSPADMRVYANEGIVQLLFLEGEPCEVSYENRVYGRKYQDQKEEITLVKV